MPPAPGENIPDEQCTFPGCHQRRQPRVPGRSGPAPRYCADPQHNAESARQARAKATSDKSARVAATAAALAEDLPPEGRVRRLVGQWAVATREAAVAADAQASLLTAAADALDAYRDEETVEARIAQATAEVDAARAAQLRAEEQARIAEQRATDAADARQAAEHTTEKAQADAEQRITAAETEARQAIDAATAAQQTAETARDEADERRRSAEQTAHDADRDRQAAERAADQQRQEVQRAREVAAQEHDALVEARAEWNVTERTLRDTIQAVTRDRDTAVRAREEAQAAQQAAVTQAAVATQRATDAERRAASAEDGLRRATERVGALTAEIETLRVEQPPRGPTSDE